MAEAGVTLYQAEWCPFSSAVREVIEYFRGTDELEAAVGDAGDFAVVDVPEANRFELRLDGRLVGLAAYRRRNGRIAFTHTEVDEASEGHGLGSRLAEAALESAAVAGLEVVPLCPFIARYIDTHPEYERLVAANYRDR